MGLCSISKTQAQQCALTLPGLGKHRQVDSHISGSHLVYLLHSRSKSPPVSKTKQMTSEEWYLRFSFGVHMHTHIHTHTHKFFSVYPCPIMLGFMYTISFNYIVWLCSVPSHFLLSLCVPPLHCCLLTIDAVWTPFPCPCNIDFLDMMHWTSNCKQNLAFPVFRYILLVIKKEMGMENILQEQEKLETYLEI